MQSFFTITKNINYENHSISWAPHRLLTKVSIFMIMYVHIFLVALFTRATLKNAIKRSIIKQKEKSGKIAITNILSCL